MLLINKPTPPHTVHRCIWTARNDLNQLKITPTSGRKQPAKAMAWMNERSDNKTDSILEILASKRLLIDHLEVLEECFQHLVVAKQNTVNCRKSTFSRWPFKTACVGSVLAVAISTSLNEDEILVNCVENCKAAIIDICRFLKTLEERTVILNEYDYAYEPMESLDNCDVFRQEAASQSQAKQLYNIFLYIQSHCLLRVALAIGSDAELSLLADEVNQLVRCLSQRANDTSKLLTLKSLTRENRIEQANDRKQPVSKDVLSIRNQSLDLSVRLATTLKHMTAMDELLCTITGSVSTNDRARLEEAESELAFIHSNLLTRSDECERLLISVKKLLNHVEEDTNLDEEALDLNLVQNGTENGNPCGEDRSPEPHEQDEFFIQLGTEGDECDVDPGTTQETLHTEEELIAKRLMKKQFRPVLLQLRERLEPIDRSFKLREKDAMKRKGIELPEETEPTRATPSGTDSDTSDDEDEPRVKRSQQRYDDVRNFLASKNQINFLSGLPAGGMQLEECILE
uniref:Vezatin n=1 Tax=Anopheles farauti TaxID=69004 RepID=A0A182Q775_9DIPT